MRWSLESAASSLVPLAAVAARPTSTVRLCLADGSMSAAHGLGDSQLAHAEAEGAGFDPEFWAALSAPLIFELALPPGPPRCAPARRTSSVRSATNRRRQAVGPSRMSQSKLKHVTRSKPIIARSMTFCSSRTLPGHS